MRGRKFFCGMRMCSVRGGWNLGMVQGEVEMYGVWV